MTTVGVSGGPGTDRRRRSRRSATTRGLHWLTALLLALLLVGAPLACGAVHRSVFVVALGVAAALAVVTVAVSLRGEVDIHPHWPMAIPVFFLLVAALQLIPLPPGLRAHIDPAGAQLLALARLEGAQPISLDPPETYRELAKAAASLCVGIAALVLSSGGRFRHWATSLVATTGIATLVVGLGHRAIGEDKIYGVFSSLRGLPVGPFINPNHTAEILELGAFAALAFSFSRSSKDGQRIWAILATLLAAGALSTLSRGAVLAFATAGATWFALAPRSDEGQPLRRTTFAGILIGALIIIGVALGLGADAMIGRFTEGGEGRLSLWYDALRVFRAHPAGIGLGAFARVYPVYRTLDWPFWVQFVENQSLNTLIEAGISTTLILVAVVIASCVHFWRNRRADRVEASLVCGLIAVIAHNQVDFGLETLGVLLPFVAILATVFGRQRSADQRAVPSSWSCLRQTTWTVASSVSAAIALAMLQSPAAQDFDALLRRAPFPASQAVAHAASLAHPTDYAYALAEARLLARVPSVDGRSSILRSLNRAMLLCPRCDEPHEEAAVELWRSGHRQQAVVEWKVLVAQSPHKLRPALDRLLHDGATNEELGSMVTDENRLDLARYLIEHRALLVAKALLNQSGERDHGEYHVVLAELALASDDLDNARRSADRALALDGRNPRAIAVAAEVALRAERTDRAIEILDKGIAAVPTDVHLRRQLLALLVRTDKWQAIDRAVAGLKTALVSSRSSLTEANIAAAHVFEKRGQFRRAMSEYQAALERDPRNVDLRLALAGAAEQVGSITVAIDAYAAVLRCDPANQQALGAMARIEREKKELEVNRASAPHTVR